MTAAQPSLPHDELEDVLYELTGSTSYKNLAVSLAKKRLQALILAQRQEAVKAFAEGLKVALAQKWEGVIEAFDATWQLEDAESVIDAALQTYLEGEKK